jgi:uracil permease
MSKKKQAIGYLPDERPPFLKLFLYAVQQVIVMFPATVAVALITGFQVSTTIFASDLQLSALFLLQAGKSPSITVQASLI